MTFVDAQNERIGDYNAWNNGTLSEWSGNAWRKLRFEGYSTGLTNASSGVLVNCPDDLSVQNFVALHGRTSKPKDSAHDGEDTFEHFPETPSCGVDRVLIGAPNVGSAFGPLRHAQRGATTLTSIVVFGGSAAQGNSRDAAGRGLVSYAFPIAAPQPPSVSGQSHATAILNHNKGFASEGIARLYLCLAESSVGRGKSGCGKLAVVLVAVALLHTRALSLFLKCFLTTTTSETTRAL